MSRTELKSSGVFCGVCPHPRRSEDVGWQPCEVGRAERTCRLQNILPGVSDSGLCKGTLGCGTHRWGGCLGLSAFTR